MQETIVGMAGATRIFGDSWVYLSYDAQALFSGTCYPPPPMFAESPAKPEWLLRLPGNVLKIDSTSANASAPRPRDGKQEIILVFL